MSSRWLTAFLEAGGDAHVVTLPPRAENAKNAKNVRREPAKPYFGNSGNFDTPPKKQKIPEGKADATADWKAFYQERAGVAERVGKMSRDRAMHMAYESCIVRWLDTHPVVSSPDICPHCQRPSGAPGTSSVPVYSGQWLHHACLDPWRAARRREAIAALAGMGIVRQRPQPPARGSL